jgi:hypothetical protein
MAANPIDSTQTTTGLRIACVRNYVEYELTKKVTDENFAIINIEKIGTFEAENYRISPQ